MNGGNAGNRKVEPDPGENRFQTRPFRLRRLLRMVRTRAGRAFVASDPRLVFIIIYKSDQSYRAAVITTGKAGAIRKDVTRKAGAVPGTFCSSAEAMLNISHAGCDLLQSARLSIGRSTKWDPNTNRMLIVV